MNNYMDNAFSAIMPISSIELKSVRKSDIDFLYKLLLERSHNENISHKIMPTYKKHSKFVMSKPYKKWYILYYKNQKLGSLYLTYLNEIGIHFKKITIPDFLITKSIELLIHKNTGKRFLINISPKNKKILKIVKNEKSKLIQYTYELQISD